MPNEDATIVTFYSYKGGVGRSMAVANVAWVLAQKFHKRVLIVDWDLEAPGLHHFFDIEDKDVSKGLIELLNDYKALVRDAQKSLPDKLVDVRKYIQPVRPFSGGGEISLLPAGKQDKNYTALINEFSWTDFYAKWHGFGLIEYLKNELKKLPETDIVIIDSRTGVTDIGGICTLQLPDIVVLLFTLNDQNIGGVRLAAETIAEKAVEIEGRKLPPALLIRPARVERTGNQDEKVKWQQIAANILGEYVTEDNPHILMAKRNIPYIGDYSYGETPLAVEKDPLGDMAEAFEDLAESILRTAGRGDASPRRISFMNYSSRAVRKFLWNARNIVILVLALVLGISLIGFVSEQRRVKSLSQDLANKSQANKEYEDELNALKGAQADWETTKPNRAWCYQLHLPDAQFNAYAVECHRTRAECEAGKKQKRTVPMTDCEFVMGLDRAMWKPSRVGAGDSWIGFGNSSFGPPFPQLP